MSEHLSRPPQGWPDASGPHASTPEGQIRQFADLAHGIRTNPRGVARAQRMLMGLALFVGAVIIAAVLFS
ncbi:MAG: hypothetical protein U0Q15_19510 [Kineosporiaceae bacterium]